MSNCIAGHRLHGLKSFLKVLLCVVLVVSLCPPFTGAFAEESGSAAESTQFGDDAQLLAVEQDEDDADDAGVGIAQDSGSADADEASVEAAEAAEGPGTEESGAEEGGDPEPSNDGAPAASDGEGTDAVADDGAEEGADEGADESTESDSASADAADDADEGAQDTELVYVDAALRATVTASDEVLNGGVSLVVEEIHPVTPEKADAYGEALTSLSDMLHEDDKVYTAAKVYDIRILDANGNEVEPNGAVKVSIDYKRAQPMGEASDPVEVAHLTTDGELEVLDAAVDTTKAGKLNSAEFEATSFSYYLVFSSDGNNTGGTTEASVGDGVGWLRMNTPAGGTWADAGGTVHDYDRWGIGTSVDTLVSDSGRSTEEINQVGSNESRRIVQIRLLNEDGTEYTPGKTTYFWTWEQSIRVEDFNLPGLEVTKTVLHTAHAYETDAEGNLVWYDYDASDPSLVPFGGEGKYLKPVTSELDSLIGSYTVRGYTGRGNTPDEVSTLDIYVKPEHVEKDTLRYIIRYVHADGSITDGNVKYINKTDSQRSVTYTLDDPNIRRDGETYSGVSVVAGSPAVSFNSGKTEVTFTYSDDVNLAKVYVYFEAAQEQNATQTKGRYDKEDGKYYNKEVGLYTDKSAQRVRDREFLVNLEAWYVDTAASVGVVLDSSGSMAWTAGEPTPLLLDELTDINGNRVFTAAELQDLANNYYDLNHAINRTNNAAAYTILDRMLDKTETDNSNLNYNSYKYYVYTHTATSTNPINEYVALGYTDGNCSGSGTGAASDGGAYTELGNDGNYIGKALITHWTSAQSGNANNVGWYYVNSGTHTTNVNNYGGKVYEGLQHDGLTGPCRFWVTTDGTHSLHCRFNKGNVNSPTTPINPEGEGNIGPGTESSLVYVKRDQMLTKAETLQDSIAQFGSILNAASPNSEVSIARYSHTRFTGNQLVLMGWSSESEDMAAALDQHGTGGSTKTGDGANNGHYQYVITGGTYARMGLNAYNDYLKGGAQTDNDKYLIIFTDGLDQGTGANATTDAYLQNTFGKGQENGYTVITVFMQSSGMSTTSINRATNNLTEWASTDENGNKLFFVAGSGSSYDVVQKFREIAEYITTGLHNYSIRDYIDPRFDVINENRQVLTVLDENGNFTSTDTMNVDANGHVGFTTPDGRYAQLGYDANKKMFYVLWQNQDIQGSSVNGDTVFPWKSQIRLQAKQDFLGGNDVLTNGNEPDENLVYKPQVQTGADGKAVLDANGDPVPVYGQNGLEVQDTTKTSKTFPFATVNPGLLDVALGNYEDTIFLGEEITPGELLSLMMGTDNKVGERTDAAHRVADTVYNEDAIGEADPDLSSKYYVEYLERLSAELHPGSDPDNPNKDFYYTLLQHVNLKDDAGTGVEDLIAALKADGNYTVTESPGSVVIEGKDNTKAASEKITITKSGGSASIKLELPYYYLESPTDGSSYAGPSTSGVDPKEDKVGMLTYEWKCVDFAENTEVNDTKNEANRFVEFDTYVNQSTHMNTATPVQYQFSISYEPLALTSDATTDSSSNASEGDGSERTRALTGLMNRDDALIRNTVGPEQQATAGEQNTTDEMGWAVIHAVDGRILVEKKMLTEDWEKAKQDMSDASMDFTLTGADITSEPADETVWSKTLPLPTTALREEGDYVYLLSEWVTGLPLGEYTLAETASGGLKLASITPRDDVEFWTDDDPAKPYDGTAGNWEAMASGATWSIGITPAVTHVNYASTTFAYGTADDYDSSVKYDLTVAGYQTPKNVDATQNPTPAGAYAKDYLNAQIGRAEVENTLQKTSIEVVKSWTPTAPSAPIVVELSGTDGTKRYAELNAANGWSYTFEGLDINQTVYSVAEGTGTVGENETCEGFSAFDEKFEHSGKKYQRVSTTYAGAAEGGSNASDAGITGSVPEKSGTATIANQELTQVTVQKAWEGVTPAAPIVIQLNSTGEDPRYVELGPDAWTYTFEDLPVATGREYSIVEGTGTVANDGTCGDFAAFATSGTFTFDGKTYQQKSLEYTPSGGAASADPLASVSPDSGTAAVTNEALTKIEVEKVWDGVDPGAETIVVQLEGSDGSKKYATFSASDTSCAFENLKVVEGLTYTVTEGTGTVAADGTCADFSAYGETFELNGQTMALSSVKYYEDADKTTEKAQDAQLLSCEVSPYGGKAVLTNGPAGADVVLSKVDKAKPEIVVEGVTFALSKGADFATATAVGTYTTSAGGAIDFGKLVPGTYWLVESAVPAGWVKRPADKPLTFTVSTQGEVTLTPDEYAEAPARLDGPDADGAYTLVVPNVHTYLLPAAGGIGVFEFLFIGAFIMALAAGYALLRRKDQFGGPSMAAPARRRR